MSRACNAKIDTDGITPGSDSHLSIDNKETKEANNLGDYP